MTLLEAGPQLALAERAGAELVSKACQASFGGAGKNDVSYGKKQSLWL